MSWGVVLAAAVLAGVAAGGVLRPFGSAARTATSALQPLADPLEDERASLFRTLRDLEDERARGELSEATYRLLKAETERRAVAVLRALDATGSLGQGPSSLRGIRRGGSMDGESTLTSASPARRRLLPIVVVMVAVLGISIPLLARAVSNRTAGQPISGFPQGSIGVATDPLTLFERRVAEHPRDLAARLDLADRYLATGHSAAAAAQYLLALQIDPRNAEAHAKLGLLLYRGGKAEEGLRAVDAALEVDPSYPEALYYRGVILLRGLHRPADAAQAFRSYLDLAPFGARRNEVQRLLATSSAGG